MLEHSQQARQLKSRLTASKIKIRQKMLVALNLQLLISLMERGTL
jgi:hypothetical protein